MADGADSTQGTRTAIEFLTLWIEHGVEAKWDGLRHVTDVVLSPESDSLEIILGHLNVAMILVYKLARERATEREDVDQRAKDILRGLALMFPE